MGYKKNSNQETSKKDINPIRYVKRIKKEKKEQKRIQAEKDYWEDVFENLENYDGTSKSQKEVRNIDER